MFNAHLHLDRAGTLEVPYEKTGGSRALQSALSLSQKHGLIPRIHASRHYDPDKLAEKLDFYLDRMVEAGTTHADTLVDVTTDRVGLTAFEVFRAAKKQRAGQIELGVGAYTPFGYRDDEPSRWELVLEAAQEADFIGSLPERDDHATYPEHIGFREHCRRILKLASELGKPIHIHVDQRNEPSECGSEIVLDVMEEQGWPPNTGMEPKVWLIHVISPSTYAEERFENLLERMVARNVGVVTCPSAAISMRQLRPLRTPTFNSIARVLDMLAAGIHVRVGSDNICDLTSPAGTPDLLAEIYVLCNALRFYDEGILAKLAAGLKLNKTERDIVAEHLKQDRGEVADAIKKWSSVSPEDQNRIGTKNP
jgi:cytosine/adenosine deaminase-related metal-dependent hydrolase